MPDEGIVAARESDAPSLVEEVFPAPCWYFLHRSWLDGDEYSSSTAWNYPLLLRLRGTLDAGALRASLNATVERHQALRSVFALEKGTIVQKVLSPYGVAFPVVDLSHVKDGARDNRAIDLMRREADRAFDLTRGPMLRSLLLRLDAEQHLFLITTHHAVCDDWSTGILLHDLFSFYRNLTRGIDTLPPVEHTYADCARWIERQSRGSEFESRVAFWRGQLAGRSFYHLREDFRRSPRRTFHGAHERLLIPAELVRRLKTFSQSERVTLFMTLLAAFQCVLHRHAGDREIGVASCVANRELAEAESVIGPFANVVVLKTAFEGAHSFRDVLHRVRETALNAYANQGVPLGELVERLDAARDPARHPFFQSVLVLQNAPRAKWQVPGLQIEQRPLDAGQSCYELMLTMQVEDGLAIDAQYNADLFRPATIRRLLSDFASVLEVVKDEPQASVSARAREVVPVGVGGGPVSGRSLPPQPSFSDEIHAQTLHTPGTEDETEKKLLAIWEGLFRIRPIQAEHDFFELGGDSLLGLHLFDQIEKNCQVRLPLATLLEAPTIRQLAALLRNAAAKPAGSSLVALERRGSRPPFFCIHGAGGSALIYRELARRIGSDQPFYGLQSRGVDGREAQFASVEEMAREYLTEIRRVQPNGPYFLGGYCMGGTVAWEIAQQLTVEGERVALLALLDTTDWSRVGAYSFWDRLWEEAERMYFHVRNFRLLDGQNRAKFFREKLNILKGRIKVWQGMALGRMARMDTNGGSRYVALAQTWMNNERAALAYVPQEYRGKVTHFKPMGQYTQYSGDEKTYARLAAGYEAITLEVYPGAMLLEPFVGYLAAALRSSMDRAMEYAATYKAAS